MWPESLTPIIVGILAGLFGWGSSWIKNLPQRDNNNMDRVNDIIQHYDNMHKNCEARYAKVCKENQRLRDEIKNLKKGSD